MLQEVYDIIRPNVVEIISDKHYFNLIINNKMFNIILTEYSVLDTFSIVFSIMLILKLKIE